MSLRAVKLVEVRGSEKQRAPLQKSKFHVVSWGEGGTFRRGELKSSGLRWLGRKSRCWTLWSDGLLRINIPAWDNWNLITPVHNFHYAQWILIENRSQFLIFNFFPSDPKYRIRAWGLLATCNQEIPSPQRDYRLLSSLHFQSTFPPRLATGSLTKGSLVLTSKVDGLSISSPRTIT